MKKIDKKAEVSKNVSIGNGTIIEAGVHIRENVIIGDNCHIHHNVYIEVGVKIGNNCVVLDNVTLVEGLVIKDGVFISASVGFSNDKYPRAINSDGTLKAHSDWTISPILVKEQASLGANSTIICGVSIGKNAIVYPGAVVTKDLPDYSIVAGVPARIIGKVSMEGKCIFFK